jgi:hypothetical protein
VGRRIKSLNQRGGFTASPTKTMYKKISIDQNWENACLDLENDGYKIIQVERDETHYIIKYKEQPMGIFRDCDVVVDKFMNYLDSVIIK